MFLTINRIVVGHCVVFIDFILFTFARYIFFCVFVSIPMSRLSRVSLSCRQALLLTSTADWYALYMDDSYINVPTVVNAAKLEVYNYNIGQNARSAYNLGKIIFRFLHLTLFTFRVPPTWRRVMGMTSLTSLHCMLSLLLLTCIICVDTLHLPHSSQDTLL